MFRTNILLNPVDIFKNCHVFVSMRPYKYRDIEKIRNISRKFRKTHREPIDWGFDAIERLGIEDLNNPEYRDAIGIDDDEIPIFW